MDDINESTDKHITELIQEHEIIQLYECICGFYLDIISNPESYYYGCKITRIIIRYIRKEDELEIGSIRRGGSFSSCYLSDRTDDNLTDISKLNIKFTKEILDKISKCDLMKNKPNLHVIYHSKKNSLIFSNRFSEIKKKTDMYYYYIHKN
jgi:hypothetical protein